MIQNWTEHQFSPLTLGIHGIATGVEPECSSIEAAIYRAQMPRMAFRTMAQIKKDEHAFVFLNYQKNPNWYPAFSAGLLV